MKKINSSLLLQIISFVVVFSSCSNKIISESSFTSNQKNYKIPISKLENVLDTVPYKEGYVTIVTYGSDTLAVSSKPNFKMFLPAGVKLPSPLKSINLNRTEDAEKECKVNYIDPKEYIGEENFSDFYQAILFEDTKNGDYDYNDLIIHVYYRLHYGNYPAEVLDIDVQGIALGSSKKIKLGVYTQTGKKYISQNVRKDFFSKDELCEEHEGKIPFFINTDKKDEGNLCHFKMKTSVVHCDVVDKSKEYVVWFIEATRNKTNETDIFVAPTSAKIQEESEKSENLNMFSTIGRPYGLIKASTFSRYPREKVNIDIIYPNLFPWIEGAKKDVASFNEALENPNYDKIKENCIRSNYGRSLNIWDVVKD